MMETDARKLEEVCAGKAASGWKPGYVMQHGVRGGWRSPHVQMRLLLEKENA